MNLKKNKVTYYRGDLEVWVFATYDKSSGKYTIKGNDITSLDTIEDLKIDFYRMDQDEIMEYFNYFVTYNALIRCKIPEGSWYLVTGWMRSLTHSRESLKTPKVIIEEVVCIKI